MTDLAAFTAAVRQFSHERDWEQFQDPKSLVLALTGEVGEVAELLQWVRAQDVVERFSDPARKARIGDELGVDLGAAGEAKLARNHERFPVAGEDSVVGVAPHKG